MANKTAWAVMITATLGGAALFAGEKGDRHDGESFAHDQDGRDQGERSQGERNQADFRWVGSVDDDQWLHVAGVNGDIEVEPSEGSEVEVVAEIRTRRGDPEDVRIEVVETSDGVYLCAIYPSRKSNETQTCGGERFERTQARNTDVSVEFRVRAPSDLHFHGETVNGDVRVNTTLAQVDATTVNGSIEAEAEGSIEARTVNGSIDALITGRTLTGPVTLETVNGSVELDLNDDVDAEVDASWVSGGFSTDLPLSIQGRIKRRARGTLGDGGERVRIKTVNGAIEIR